MKLNVLLAGVFCCSAMVAVAAPVMFQDQEDVRGAFLTSRPKDKPVASSNTQRPSRRKPKVTPTPAPTPVATGPKNTKPPVTNKNPKVDTKPVNVARMGLGITLFMRDANGSAVRTDPNRVFHAGDRVRVLLETNTDGYLYIFNTTNDGPPVMIYPDADLDEGGNYLQSHVPFEIPSSLATEERFRWLAFDQNAGDEKLIFVFTKDPIKGLPIDDELIALCRGSKEACPVKPTADIWAQVESERKQPLTTDEAEPKGQKQTEVEKQATTRGLGLAKDDPQPTMIMMASSRSSTLVTTLALIHK